MTRKHYVAIAKTIRDSDEFGSEEGRYAFAVAMADVLSEDGMVKNFDRDVFMAFATSAA